MLPAHEITKVRELLLQSKNILIALPQNPNVDQTAAALCLYFALKKVGKSAQVVCADRPTVELSAVIGADLISDQVSGGNLVISIDYTEGSIEKVSYNVEGDKFNLVIHTPPDASPVTTDKIRFSSSGMVADCIVCIGALSLDDLGKIVKDNQASFSQATIVNIDRQTANTRYGSINVIDKIASSISEMVFLILRSLSQEPDPDIVRNVFAGVLSATDNFQSPHVSPEAFEAAAWCLRHGARPKNKQPDQALLLEQKPTAITKDASELFTKIFAKDAADVLPVVGNPVPNPKPDVINEQKVVNQQLANFKMSQELDDIEDDVPDDPLMVDPNWTKPPKVYRGSSES
ncbi:hypothetical protein HY388_01160 [Candidatus Daviesbacteria bacterium]|nr:hypothetical protein [Candidatus Daviesbacteria bacterium]